MKQATIGLIIGFSLAGNIYAVALHTGAVVSVKTACAESAPEDILDRMRRNQP